jgi:hypothetical protein
LVDQGLEKAISGISVFKSNNSKSIAKLLFENQFYLEQLKNNSKLNLNLDTDSGDNLFQRIFISSEVKFLITIILGRVLTIV